MAGVGWCEHAGVRYLHVTYAGATADDALAILEECADLVRAEPGPLLMLVDVSGADLDRAWVSRAKAVTMTVFVPRRARMVVVGLTQVMELALRGMKRLGQLRTLDGAPSVEAALEVLTNGEGRRGG